MNESNVQPHTIGLNVFQLKCIAIVSMVFDHVGLIFFPDEIVFRAIGRISFPVFCFVLVEGFIHTHDQWRYLFRLGLFALISEIPFDLARSGTWMDPAHQNVFFTLFFGFAMLCGLRLYKDTVGRALVIVIAIAFAAVTSTDYGIMGVLLILVYYVMRDYKWPKLALGALWNFCFRDTVQFFGVFAALPLAVYNGEKGRSLKWAFYIFYPVHLLLLYAIKMLLSVN